MEHPLQVIARRTLVRCGDRETVQITVFSPTQSDRANQDWECAFEVTGAVCVERQMARGVDSLQALIEAIRGIRHVLREHSSGLTWLSGTAGDTGIPTVLPYDDPDFSELLEGLVDLEIQRRYVYSQRPPARSSGAGKNGDEE